jgi:hypothetical protein
VLKRSFLCLQSESEALTLGKLARMDLGIATKMGTAAER